MQTGSKNSLQEKNNSIYDYLLEDFFHNISGKINIINLMMEMEYSYKDIQKNIKFLEGLLILYRDVLLKRKIFSIQQKPLIVNLFEDRGSKLVLNEMENCLHIKVCFLCFLYQVSSDNTIIINKNQIICMEKEKIHLENLIKKLKILTNEKKELDFFKSTNYEISSLDLIINLS